MSCQAKSEIGRLAPGPVRRIAGRLVLAVLTALSCASLVRAAEHSGRSEPKPVSGEARAVGRFLDRVFAQATDGPTQVVAVVSERWSSPAALLLRLEPRGQSWRAGGRSIRVALGRSGMGWGLGLQPKRYPRSNTDPVKREGDGRSPAGVFSLGPAFGARPRPPRGTTLPYRQITKRDYFVDDPSSNEYNTWQRIPRDQPNDPSARWRSFERMRRADGDYDLGVVVGHNQTDRVPGAGSAIFLHLGRLDQPTVGCVAMSRGDMVRLLRWLDATGRPVVLLLPRPVLRRNYTTARSAGDAG